MDEQILTNALADVKTLAFSGFGLVEGNADELLWWLVSFSVIAMFIAWFMRPAATPVEATAPWVGLLITLNVVAAIMGVLPNLSYAWIDFMQNLGLYAGQGTGSGSLEDVSAVLDAGWTAARDLRVFLADWRTWFNVSEGIVFLVCFFLILIAHCVLAYQLIRLFGEFYILSVVALCCLPFAVWRWTLFLAEGAARYILTNGICVMAIAFGFSLVHSMVGGIVLDKSAEIGTTIGKTAAMVILLCIVAGLPRGIRNLITGSPNTDFGGEVRSIVWTTTAAAGAARAAMVMGGTIGSTISGGVGSAVSAARTAMGAVPSGISMNSGFTGSGSGYSPRGLAGSMATLSGSKGGGNGRP